MELEVLVTHRISAQVHGLMGMLPSEIIMTTCMISSSPITPWEWKPLLLVMHNMKDEAITLRQYQHVACLQPFRSPNIHVNRYGYAQEAQEALLRHSPSVFPINLAKEVDIWQRGYLEFLEQSNLKTRLPGSWNPETILCARQETPAQPNLAGLTPGPHTPPRMRSPAFVNSTWAAMRAPNLPPLPNLPNAPHLTNPNVDHEEVVLEGPPIHRETSDDDPQLYAPQFSQKFGTQKEDNASLQPTQNADAK
jgi:hypothetical protein